MLGRLGGLATIGYAAPGCEQFIKEVFAANRRAVLVDTRLSPHCNWSKLWQRAALAKWCGKRYLWKGNLLGNIHYAHPEKPIQLADEEQGIAWVISWLEKGITLILLCGCTDYKRCHRKVIYDKVTQRLGSRWKAFELGERVMTPHGPGMIDPHVPLEVHRARNRYAVLLDQWHPQRYYFPDELETLEAQILAS